jgi:4-hydroxy-tetrahydrodipicolinate reductase
VKCDATLKSELDDTVPPNAVFIEFSPSPNAAVEHCKAAAEKGLGVVIGTTGFEEHQLDQVRECATSIPIVYSPNMSVGVNVLFKLAEEVSAILADRYDIEIIDIHHKMKRDAPSGTAAKLADIIAKQVEEKTGQDAPIIYGRQPGTPSEKREGNEVVIHSLRTGEVVGEHTLVFAGPGERLEITHRAASRETFAQGTLQAVEFIQGKIPALYTMTDVLGI